MIAIYDSRKKHVMDMNKKRPPELSVCYFTMDKNCGFKYDEGVHGMDHTLDIKQHRNY